MDILEIFYNNVVPEAMNGRINCLSYYNIAFSTEIVDEGVRYSCNIDDEGLLIPTLMIKNKSRSERGRDPGSLFCFVFCSSKKIRVWGVPGESQMWACF